MPTPFRILGIDPGFDRMGFGVIEDHSGTLTYLAHGCVQTDARHAIGLRLQLIRNELGEVIKKYQPTTAVVEKLFFQTNVKTAMTVGMARGVIMLALADARIPVVEVTPQQVKQGVAGWGRASKKDIQQMVARLLKMKTVPEPDDAADALAIAIVGSSVARFEQARTLE